MAFRPPKKQPEFADLIGILAQTKQAENPLYQTLSELINRLTQFQLITLQAIADINDSINNSQALLNIIADKRATYLTAVDEKIRLPNSRWLIAGTGIVFDDTVANQRTISAGGNAYYDAPLTDGNVDETDLIFALGECIIVQVPV